MSKPILIRKIGMGRTGDPDFNAYNDEDLLTEFYSRPRDLTFKEWRNATAQVAPPRDLHAERRLALSDLYDRDDVAQRLLQRRVAK